LRTNTVFVLGSTTRFILMLKCTFYLYVLAAQQCTQDKHAFALGASIKHTHSNATIEMGILIRIHIRIKLSIRI